MMGIKERNFAPLPSVTLEALIPPDHFYRHLERSIDLSFVRQWVHDLYAERGRPSIDPVSRTHSGTHHWPRQSPFSTACGVMGTDDRSMGKRFAGLASGGDVLPIDAGALIQRSVRVLPYPGPQVPPRSGYRVLKIQQIQPSM
jgi:hypothetical protein